jgi:hypothetical protein
VLQRLCTCTAAIHALKPPGDTADVAERWSGQATLMPLPLQQAVAAARSHPDGAADVRRF